MIRIIPLFFLILIACDKHKKYEGQFPAAEEKGWITYEGRVPIDELRNLSIEISMLPGGINGEGFYHLNEFLEDETGSLPLSNLKGRYSTLQGAGGELMIEFLNSAQLPGLKRIYYRPDGKKIREEPFRKTDLIVKSKDENILIVLNYNSEPVTDDPRCNLIKRTSKLFTIEGYFTHLGDSAYFLEMNTNEKWPVSKLGVYEQAARQYHQLAKDESEGIYIKGIGYSVNIPDKQGKEIEALALKKIIQMTSAPEQE